MPPPTKSEPAIGWRQSRHPRALFWRVFNGTTNGPVVGTSIRNDGPEAQYDDKAERYCHDVRLTSAQPFSLHPVLIDSGPYAGTQALVVTPPSHFPFTKLPKELRHMIYDNVFRSYGPLRVSRLRTKNSKARPTGGIVTANRRDCNVEAKDFQALKLPSLLHVSKTISAESLEFLFAQDYTFDSMGTMNEVLRNLNNDAKRHLRHIVVETSSITKLSTCFGFLEECKKLRTFTFSIAAGFQGMPERSRGTLEQHIDNLAGIEVFIDPSLLDLAEIHRRLSLLNFSIERWHTCLFENGARIYDITPAYNEWCRRRLKRNVELFYVWGRWGRHESSPEVGDVMEMLKRTLEPEIYSLALFLPDPSPLVAQMELFD